MKYFIFGFFIFLVWFIAGSWIYLCNVKGLCVKNYPDASQHTSPPTKEIDNVPKHTVNQSLTPTIMPKTTIEPIKNSEIRKVLYFDFDSEKYRIDHELEQYIINLKTFLNTYPDKKIRIIGHTDNVGETSDNEWIGMQRAKSAMRYLVAKGIAEDRILVMSKGETEPIVPNTSKEGRRQNRRVEIMMN